LADEDIESVVNFLEDTGNKASQQGDVPLQEIGGDREKFRSQLSAFSEDGQRVILEDKLRAQQIEEGFDPNLPQPEVDIPAPVEEEASAEEDEKGFQELRSPDNARELVLDAGIAGSVLPQAPIPEAGGSFEDPSEVDIPEGRLQEGKPPESPGTFQELQQQLKDIEKNLQEMNDRNSEIQRGPANEFKEVVSPHINEGKQTLSPAQLFQNAKDRGDIDPAERAKIDATSEEDKQKNIQAQEKIDIETGVDFAVEKVIDFSESKESKDLPKDHVIMVGLEFDKKGHYKKTSMDPMLKSSIPKDLKTNVAKVDGREYHFFRLDKTAGAQLDSADFDLSKEIEKALSDIKSKKSEKQLDDSDRGKRK